MNPISPFFQPPIATTFAASEFLGDQDWTQRKERLERYQVLRRLKPMEFLQAIILISDYHQRIDAQAPDDSQRRVPGVGGNHQDVLPLDLSQYQRWAEPITQRFEAVARFLHTQAIFDADDLPYPQQVVVMAPLFVVLGKSLKFDRVRQRIEQWFYCAAASGIYSRWRQATATKDLREIPQWLKGGEMPATIKDAHLPVEHLQSLLSCQGATYKLLTALLRRDGALDFLSGEPIRVICYFQQQLDNHHIFPQQWCKQQGIPRSRYDSIVNKTPLTANTNNWLGGKAPSEYLAQLEAQGMSPQRIDEILRSHQIEPETLWHDDFESFFETRTRALLARLSKAMGKTSTPEMPQALGKGEVQPNYNALLWTAPTPIDQTPLLFGNGFLGKPGEVMKGLDPINGGVYHRHPQYEARPIKVAALKLYRVELNRFLSYLEKSLERCGFQNHFVIGKSVAPNEQGATSRVDLKKALDEIAALAPDVVLVFLPQSDRSADPSGSGSLHPFVELHLLRRQIATQFIYTDTFQQLHSWQIMHQIVPGILAKVGNLPFILAEPLAIADYFMGLDISYSPQPGQAGSNPACASIRLHGKQGEFIRYRLEELRLEGEEIPQGFWERLLPSADLAGKTALIYREERFCGNEVSSLLQWAQALQAKLILVECLKSGVTQLDSSSETLLEPMNLGLAFRLSPVEAILAITKVCPDAGLPRALVLRVHQQGHPACVEQVLDATQKLTLLHHGALKTPHLPMPLHGTERMAYLKLNGIYPSFIEGDRQFWL
jgi:hypothetical protein